MSLRKCRECGNEISTSATSCPKCGAKRKSSSGAWLFIILVFVALIAVCPNRDSEPIRNRPRAAVDPVIEKTIQEWLAANVIDSMNVEFNEVRIDPVVWIPLPLENKRGFLTIFSNYFESKGSTGRVTILSNRNDQKLATYSSWDGMKILE